ncbi:MAG: PEP-CTERM sorting domain-containing protein [Planctomycetota bacterium]
MPFLLLSFAVSPLPGGFLMRWVFRFLPALVLALGLSVQAQAGPMLAVSSTADLNNLKVGQTITFDVTLSGLNAGDSLDYLAGTLTFNDTLFSIPLSVTAGPIVPDLTGFSGTKNVGLADGNYDDLFALSGTPITSNGVFFSFNVTVTSTGTGMVGFDFADSFGFDANGGLLDPTTGGNPITFDAPANNAIPEPMSLLLLGIGGAGVLLARRGRKKQSQK